VQDTSQVSDQHVQQTHGGSIRPYKKTDVASHAVDSGQQNAAVHITADTIKFTQSSANSVKFTDVWKTHELKPVHHEPQQLTDSNPDWLFLVLIIVLGVLTYLRVFYRKNFFQIIAACFNNNLTNQIVRDENLLMQRASVMLNVTFSIIAASFIYLVSVHYNWPMDGMGTGFIRFVFLALIVSAAFTLKFLVLRCCAYLFKLGREMSTYIFNIFIINNLLGIALVPFVALILFGNSINSTVLIVSAISVIGIAWLYRVGRGVLIAARYPDFSPVYLFLYLCALEIAPLLVLVKLVSKQ
jgi:hypothetical protein